MRKEGRGKMGKGVWTKDPAHKQLKEQGWSQEQTHSPAPTRTWGRMGSFPEAPGTGLMQEWPHRTQTPRVPAAPRHQAHSIRPHDCPLPPDTRLTALWPQGCPLPPDSKLIGLIPAISKGCHQKEIHTHHPQKGDKKSLTRQYPTFSGLGLQNEAGQKVTVLSREHTGHSKHLPTTQEDSTHGHHQMVNT